MSCSVNDNSKGSGFTDIYELKETLGIGPFSVVKRCVHRQTSREYGTEIIDTKKLNTKCQHFQREVETCRVLEHPNILRLHASIAEEARHYLVFELFTGRPLFKDIASRAYYSEADASLYIRQIIAGIYYCHQNNIIHKYVMPERLLLAIKQKETGVKFANFGLAIEVPDHDRALFSFLSALEYLSPEVLRHDLCGKPVDMWACGVILYILLVGYAPFSEPNRNRLTMRISAADYDFPSPEWDTVTLGAKDLLKKMFTQDPKSRITAHEALQHPWINQRDTIASRNHRQNTIDCLKKFNAKPRLRSVVITARFGITVRAKGRSLLGNEENKDGNGARKSSGSGRTTDNYQTEAKKAEIIRLTEQILKAKFDCNFEAYCKLVSTDMSCFEPETCGNLVKGMDFHMVFFESNPTKRVNSSIIVHPHVTLLGDDGACIAYVNLLQNRTSNDQVAVKQVEETMVWKRVNGAWRMFHSHRSEHPDRTSNSDS